GLPGTIYSKNITPYNLGKWTDGEIIRAVTQGITKDNKALFPLMPYMHYNNMTEEDIHSIVAYIRSLKPIKKDVPEHDLNFPVSLIVKTLPLQTYNPPKVDKSDTKAYGKYLVTLASCSECHTPAEKGEPIKGKDFAGGNEFQTPVSIIRTANITPDIETGIGKWTKDDFIKRFKANSTEEAKHISVKPTDFNTVMPWTMYAGMTEEDLGSIYDYLRTLKPIKNNVIHFKVKNLASK
ncbi:MAG: c-type cytochrome, partial [Ignavibacteriaceae bacterium]